MDFRRQKRRSTLGTRNRDFNITFNASHNNQSVTSKYEGIFIAPNRISENNAFRRSILGSHKAKRESTLPTMSGYLSCCENSTVNTNFSKLERNSMIPCHISDLPNQIIRNEKTIKNENLSKFNSSLLSPLKNLVLDVTLTKSINNVNQGDTLGCNSLSSLANDSFISSNNSFDFEETITKLIEDTDVTLKRESILPASNAKPTLPCENESERGKKFALKDTTSESADTNDPALKISSFSSPLKSCENLLSDEPETSYSEAHLFSPICSSTNTRKTNVQSPKHTKRSKDSLEDDAYVVNKTDDVSRALKYLDALIERSTTLVSNYEEQMKGVHLKLEDSKKELENLTTIRKFMTEKIIGVEKCGRENKWPMFMLSDTEGRKEEFNSPQYSPSRQVIQEMRSTIKFLKTPRMSRAPRQSMLLTPHTMSFCIKSQYEKLLE